MYQNILSNRLLYQLESCEMGIKFCNQYGLIGFPVDKIPKIRGDFNRYFLWFKKRIRHLEFDDSGRLVKQTIYGKVIEFHHHANTVSFTNIHDCNIKLTFEDDILIRLDSNNYYSLYTYIGTDIIITDYDINGIKRDVEVISEFSSDNHTIVFNNNKLKQFNGLILPEW